ncbi:MAG: biotin carboxylase N-terminal domain-containing protein [Pseudomonadota bacterium]|nr:biotin carboxylase N-terminal domain-containing protein [Pseudomonadota bacterium]
MFDKVLIANRGEIACRIARTCRRMGILTAAVYSSADRNALHIKLADEAVRIGAAPASESYQNITAVMEAARATGVEAIHPGFGFLSENADFAEACAAEGIVFIGPSAEAIRTMASKSRAKSAVATAGIPVIPGNETNLTDAELMAAASAFGYPLLLKPAAGGGGRGMRVLREGCDIESELSSARREALLSFGDDTILIEKYFENTRHIEVQIFGDTHGNVIHFFERDCSVQRRYQKVVEEAPAPGLGEDVRKRLFDAAIAIGKSVGYTGAGTVEFLLTPDDKLWFMEMNTRLQVEHPVTELITGIDLVEWQFRVGAGEKLPLKQSQIACDGHAIEVRLYAEDPANAFAPGVGVLSHLNFPAETDRVRVDTGVREGDDVTVYYDPMLAKIITRGDDRSVAVELLSEELGRLRVSGPATNARFLKAVVDHPEFRRGAVNTGFVDHNLQELVDVGPVPDDIFAIAALAEMTRAKQPAVNSPWALMEGWTLGGISSRNITFVGETGHLRFEYRGDGLVRDAKPVNVSGIWMSANEFTSVIRGEEIPAVIIRDGCVVTVFVPDGNYKLIVDDLLVSSGPVVSDVGNLFASMPGIVVDVLVKQGATVVAGATLLVIEAMKVEHTIRAPSAGTVTAIHFETGDRVTEGDELVSLSD